MASGSDPTIYMDIQSSPWNSACRTAGLTDQNITDILVSQIETITGRNAKKLLSIILSIQSRVRAKWIDKSGKNDGLSMRIGSFLWRRVLVQDASVAINPNLCLFRLTSALVIRCTSYFAANR